MKIIEMAGKECGRLTVIEKHHQDKNGRWHWLCMCSCGNEAVVSGKNLRNGRTKSCGCLMREMTGNINRSHGLSGDRLYKTWASMIQRCYNPNNKEYKNYGARGIVVCNEWKNSFESFNEWAISSGYNKKLTIERIDVNKNYEPSNCRWATSKEQARNTRVNKLLTFNGESLCLAAWAEKTGIKYPSLVSRLNSGWTEEEALTTPVGSRKVKRNRDASGKFITNKGRDTA